MTRILSGAAVAALLLSVAAWGDAQDTPGRTVRLTVAVRVPEAAVIREIKTASIGTLPDGRREVSFAVSVSANCRWTMSVRRRAWWDFRPLDPIDVLRADGTWVALAPGAEAITLIPDHEPCHLDTHVVRLRLRDAAAERVLERVEFVVAPEVAR